MGHTTGPRRRSRDSHDRPTARALSRLSTGAALAIVIAVTGAAFHPSTHNEFVDWDDFQNLTQNEHIRSLSAKNFYWMATTGHMAVWQPVSWFVTAIEYRLFDGADPASFSRGMHVTNVLLHALGCCLCFFVIRRLIALTMPGMADRSSPATNGGALLGTLLFAVHPLRVETVAWATAQPYILALVGSALTVWFYLRAQETGRSSWLVFSTLCFAFALMAKSAAVPLFLVLSLLDWHPLRRLGGSRGWWGAQVRGVWWEKVPYAVLGVCVLVIAPMAKGGAGSAMSLAAHGPAARIAQACYGLVFYPLKTLVPVGLTPIYEIQFPLRISDPKYFVSILVVVVVAVGLVVARRRLRGMTAAVLAYAVMVLPVLGFLQSGNQEVADRYSYLSCVALSVPIAGGWVWLWRRGGPSFRFKIPVGLAAAAVLVLLAGLTWRQCGFWRDTASLWTRAVDVQEDSSLAQNGYGYVLLQEGRVEEAIERFQRAIEIKPTNDVAHENLWNAFQKLGRLDDLALAYQEGLRVFPDWWEVHRALGNVRFRQHRYREAIESYESALRLQPDDARTHATLAAVFQTVGETEDAIRHAKRALALDPSLDLARRILTDAEGGRNQHP